MSTALQSDPGIEVHVQNVREPRDASIVFEVWTQRTVYGFDGQFNCTRVIDRETGQHQPNHPRLGSRLSGGRRTRDDVVEVSTPFPARGSRALLGTEDGMAVTSAVDHVVIYVQRVAFHDALSGAA